MKKFVKPTSDDSATAGGHIHFPRILAFASESADFTEKENAHFDVCRTCRFKVFYALRNVASQIGRTIRMRAA